MELKRYVVDELYEGTVEEVKTEEEPRESTVLGLLTKLLLLLLVERKRLLIFNQSRAGRIKKRIVELELASREIDFAHSFCGKLTDSERANTFVTPFNGFTELYISFV